MKSENVSFIAKMIEDDRAFGAPVSVGADYVDRAGNDVITPIGSNFDKVQRRDSNRIGAGTVKDATINPKGVCIASPVRAEGASEKEGAQVPLWRRAGRPS